MPLCCRHDTIGCSSCSASIVPTAATGKRIQFGSQSVSRMTHWVQLILQLQSSVLCRVTSCCWCPEHTRVTPATRHWTSIPTSCSTCSFCMVPWAPILAVTCIASVWAADRSVEVKWEWRMEISQQSVDHNKVRFMLLCVWGSVQMAGHLHDCDGAICKQAQHVCSSFTPVCHTNRANNRI